MNKRIAASQVLIAAGLLVALTPSAAWAYIGPGAGFALAGSLLAFFWAVLSAIGVLLFWPIRRLVRVFFRRRPPGRVRFKRVVIVGLDGLDHGLSEKFMAEGKLPHLAALRQQGDFRRLETTLPPISPVAWATFQTGVNPGKHNIFDFLTPDPRTYQAKLSSVEIRNAPGGKPDVRLMRKSQPFWSILSRYGIFNCILRVPITFPPEKLRGVQLSAMCVPDLRGTQGTFSHYTTRPAEKPAEAAKKTGGEVHYVKRQGNVVACELLGPNHTADPRRGPLKLPFTITITAAESI